MLKLFGVLDLLAAVFLVLAQWDFGLSIATFLAGYLILKALIFITNWSSWIDLLAGVYLILVVQDVHSAFSLIFTIWLLQKGFFSLIV
ncbi:MAG: hypothetical protein CMH63_00340 [Nanoarchaeota archaeon]|jgi:hypothetical protein|nr:hypothetical protein [Nanoarchaeota archaeon]|tara:strand:- start:8919 stop:9182 length:264 start_codon:yes stop_codon:yes gene_type:complete